MTSEKNGTLDIEAEQKLFGGQGRLPGTAGDFQGTGASPQGQAPGVTVAKIS